MGKIYGKLLDQFGRQARDLRISVTDRCNLRCTYCLPEDHQQWIKRDQLLSPWEIYRLARVGLGLGITQIRITGGEPLLRPDLVEIISGLKQAFSEAELPAHIALTTNAIGLEARAGALKEAGLQRVNVSLDSLQPERYRQLARRGELKQVLAGINAAQDVQLQPLKINTVVLDHQTLAELPALIKWCLRRGLQWRGIEFMPIGPLSQTNDQRPTAAEIRKFLGRYFSLSPQGDSSSPARLWDVAAGPDHPEGTIGLITSTTDPFCHRCERTRLSAEGKVFPCLFSPLFIDLGQALRQGASEAELAELWQRVTVQKPAGHQVLPTPGSRYSLSMIGG